MKKRALLAGMAGIMLAVGAGGAYTQGFGGFTGLEDDFPGFESRPTRTTIAGAARLPDYSPVILRGRITRSLDRKKNRFLSRDSTGEIIVDINRRVWDGLLINERDRVEIFGYTDKDGGQIEKIKVKSIRKL